MEAVGFDRDAPTLVITECVLIYLKPEDTKNILGFIKDFIRGDAAILNYEMINPSDPFGKVMLENLEVFSTIRFHYFRIAVADYKEFMNVQLKPLR